MSKFLYGAYMTIKNLYVAFFSWVIYLWNSVELSKVFEPLLLHVCQSLKTGMLLEGYVIIYRTIKVQQLLVQQVGNGWSWTVTHSVSDPN